MDKKTNTTDDSETVRDPIAEAEAFARKWAAVGREVRTTALTVAGAAAGFLALRYGWKAAAPLIEAALHGTPSESKRALQLIALAGTALATIANATTAVVVPLVTQARQ